MKVGHRFRLSFEIAASATRVNTRSLSEAASSARKARAGSLSARRTLHDAGLQAKSTKRAPRRDSLPFSENLTESSGQTNSWRRSQFRPKPLGCLSIVEGSRIELAERGGFEPPVLFPVHTLSKRAPSATRTPLRTGANNCQTSLIQDFRRASRADRHF